MRDLFIGTAPVPAAVRVLPGPAIEKGPVMPGSGAGRTGFWDRRHDPTVRLSAGIFLNTMCGVLICEPREGSLPGNWRDQARALWGRFVICGGNNGTRPAGRGKVDDQHGDALR